MAAESPEHGDTAFCQDLEPSFRPVAEMGFHADPGLFRGQTLTLNAKPDMEQLLEFRNPSREFFLTIE
jgi:hypothetical protein